MTKVRLHPLIEEIRGTLNGVVFKRSPTGEMIIAKRPDMSNVEWSQAQKAQRARFTEAVAYAQAALANPKVRAKYQRKAKRLHKRAWDVAMADYFKGNDLLSKGKATR